MKRIAIAIEGENGLEDNISSHFGRCKRYVLADVEGDEVVSEVTVDNPHFGHHGACVIPEFISNQKADVMIAGGMGIKAMNLFDRFGIEVVTGASGKAETALREYLKGNLEGVEPCKEHHGC